MPELNPNINHSNAFNKYMEIKKTGKDISENDINAIVKAGKLKDSEVKEIIKDIYSDKDFSKNEMKMVLALSVASDENLVENFKKTEKDFSPSSTAVSDLFEKGAKKLFNEAIDNSISENDFTSFGKFKAPNIGKQVSKILDKELEKFEGSAQKNDCIKSVLNKLGYDTTNLNIDEIQVSKLKKETNMDWSMLNKNSILDLSPEELNKLSEKFKDKALIVQGGHTYVFAGFKIDEKTGKKSILLKDANDDFAKPIEKDFNKNDLQSLRLYIPEAIGKSDNRQERFIRKDIRNNEVRATENDKDENGKTTQSFEVRKLMALMGDPRDRETLKKLVSLSEAKDINGIIELLKNHQPSIDFSNNKSEIESFILKMNTKIIGKDNKPTSMFNELLKLSDRHAVHIGKITKEEQYNYQAGIRYSDVDLNQYFFKTDTKTMYKSLQKLINGDEGC
ncbi:MAG: hypothetical protein U0457_05570 [Candidatus Sericytochromatia bacterium]